MSQIYKASTGGGGGNVIGPGSSTDRAIATWDGTTGDVLFDNPTTNIDSNGIYTNSGQPSFSAYLGEIKSNVTGDGTLYQIPFDNRFFERGGSNFNYSTGVYVCPSAGVYLFTGNIYLTNILIANSSFAATIQNTTASVNYPVNFSNPFPIADTSGSAQFSFSKIVNCSAGDNIQILIAVSNGPLTVGILGNSGNEYTYFDGFLFS